MNHLIDAINQLVKMTCDINEKSGWRDGPKILQWAKDVLPIDATGFREQVLNALGFHTNGVDAPEKLGLITTEVVEAYEDARVANKVSLDNFYYVDEHGEKQIVTLESSRAGKKPEGFFSELADIAIRLFDLAGYFETSLGYAIVCKLEYNKTRSYRHGNKLA